MKKIFYFLLLSLFIISCVSKAKIEKDISKQLMSISYIYDSKPSNCDKKDTITISSFQNVSFPKETIFEEIENSFDKCVFNIILGQSSVKEYYNDFFIEGLSEESKRSGCFIIEKYGAEKHNYTLNISIDTCSSSILYEAFYGDNGNSEMASSPRTYLYVHCILKKGDSIVYKNYYEAKSTSGFISSKAESYSKLRKDTAYFLAESLSDATKTCIQEIIADLNKNVFKK
jgi:hypothetical protein